MIVMGVETKQVGNPPTGYSCVFYHTGDGFHKKLMFCYRWNSYYNKRKIDVTISVDCVMSEWSEWSRKCCPIRGFGAFITRTRSVVTPASNGGKECGETKEERFINPLACDDCKSSCTDKLGKWRCKQMEHKCTDENHKPSIMKNCGETCCKDLTQNINDCYGCRNKAGRESTHRIFLCILSHR